MTLIEHVAALALLNTDIHPDPDYREALLKQLAARIERTIDEWMVENNLRVKETT